MGKRGHQTEPAGRPALAYLFNAICPYRGKGAALAVAHADTMQLHINSHMSPKVRMPYFSSIAAGGLLPARARLQPG